MDYLDEQEDKGHAIEFIDRLKQRKQDLINRLEKLRNQKFEVGQRNEVISEEQRNVSDCKVILDMYRLHGVCIKSMGPDLVLRFDPLYKNQYPTTEHYSVQLLRKGENYKLGKHNLPPFIPASQLLEKYIGNGIKEFVEEVRKLLYAYIQRREGLKEAKKTFENNFHDEVEADIAVSYVKFKLRTSENFPPMEVTMQYSLEKCLPDTLEMSPAGTDEETYSMSRKTLEHRLKVMRQILLKNDIFTALSQIVQKYS